MADSWGIKEAMMRQRRDAIAADPQYDTKLSPEEEQQFQVWRQSLPPDLQNTYDYDLRGAWKSGAEKSLNDHLTDVYKKPNHMTFSDQSMYKNAAPRQGDHWQDNADGSVTDLVGLGFDKFHDPSDLLNYFQTTEKGNQVKLPKGTK